MRHLVAFIYAAYHVVIEQLYVPGSKYLERLAFDLALGLACVFFAQQSVEKRPKGLWEGPFFVAWGGPSSNVGAATEGGIPMSLRSVFELPSGGESSQRVAEG